MPHAPVGTIGVDKSLPKRRQRLCLVSPLAVLSAVLLLSSCGGGSRAAAPTAPTPASSTIPSSPSTTAQRATAVTQPQTSILVARATGDQVAVFDAPNA